MTLCELSERYKIGLDKLQYFADNQLIEEKPSYNDKDEKMLGMLCTLYDVGLNADVMKRFLLFNNKNNSAEQIRLLSMSRSELLEDIHARQKKLDRLDYMIYEIKNKGVTGK